MTADIVFLALLGPISLAATLFGLRFIVRHLIRNYRERLVGELRWTRFSQTPSGGTRDRKAYTVSDFLAIKALISHISEGWSTRYSRRGIVSIVWLRDPDTQMIDLYVGMDEAHYDDGQVLRSLAVSLNATAIPQDNPPDVPTDEMFVGFRDKTNPSTIQPQVDSSGNLALGLSQAWADLDKGDSVAVVITLDMMRNSEGKRFEANMAEEGIMRSGVSSQYSQVGSKAQIMGEQGVRFSIATSNNMGSARVSERALTHALGSISTLGWKVTRSRLESRHVRSAATLGIVSSVIVGVAAFLLRDHVALAVSIPLAAVPFLTAILNMANHGIAINRWVRSRLHRGEIVVPHYTWWSLRFLIVGRLRAFRRDRRDTGSGGKFNDLIAPPSCRQVMILHLASLFEVLSFPSTDVATDVSTSTLQRLGVPNDMVTVKDQGIYIGESGTDQTILYDLLDIGHSIYVSGSPSSGKSNMMLVLYAGMMRASWEQANGLDITPIWIETKGEGAYLAWHIASKNPDGVMIDCNNPASPYRLALEGRRLSEGASVGEVRANVIQLVSAMQTAWGDGIGSQAREIADSLFMSSMLLTPDDIRFLELDDFVDPEKPNIINLSWFLTGQDNRVNPSRKLLDMHEDLDLGNERERALSDALAVISRFLGKSAQRSAGERLSAVLNKLSDLRRANLLWEPDSNRADVYLGQIVGSERPVVINLGAYREGGTGQYNNTLDSVVSQYITRIIHYNLWQYIDSHCAGWEEMGRRTVLFFDEVTDVSQTAEGTVNTLEDGTKQGRSKGLSYVLGNQYPGQLNHKVRDMVLSFRTKYWFNLHKDSDQEVAVKDLTSGERNSLHIRNSSIRRLPDGTAMGIMKRRQTVTPPFILKVPEAISWADHLMSSKTVWDGIASYSEERQRKDQERAQIEQG